MNKVVTATLSVPFTEEGRGTELTLALRTGERTKEGVYVHLTPVVDAEMGCTEGTLGIGEIIVDEEPEEQYVEWNGKRYGLAEGDVDVEAEIYKIVSGDPEGILTVNMDELEITSKGSWFGIVKITKKQQNKRFLWRPPNSEEESEAMVWAYYEGKTGIDGQNVTKTAEDFLKKSLAITQVMWPPEEERYPISLTVGRQDNDKNCVYVYQTPNPPYVDRGCDVGSLEVDTTVNTKNKEIYTIWDGSSISLPTGIVSCNVDIYKVYQGNPGGLNIDITNEVVTTKEEWVGIVKITTVIESLKLKWIPPDPEKRTQAVVHAYRRGSVAMTNIEWVPQEEELEIRLELNTSSSLEATAFPLTEITIRQYPVVDTQIGCTEGGVRKGEIIREHKERYLEFQLVPLPDITKLEDSAWEPDDEIDATGVSMVNIGKSCLDVKFTPLDCFDRAGEAVVPELTYNEETGNAIGDQSFYGLVKVEYDEEYQQILYQQAYRLKDNGVIDVLTGYVYAFYQTKAAFCEVPWDTNLPKERKDLYWVYSYYVVDKYGTFEYPDNWLEELKKEVPQSLEKMTYEDFKAMLESRDPGTFVKDPNIEIHPENNSIQERIHRTGVYDWLGTLHEENHQPIRGFYYKPYTDVKPKKDSSYKPVFFLRFAGKPKLDDLLGEFAEDDYTESEFTGKQPLYLPKDSTREALQKGWEAAFARFNQDKIYEKLKEQFPGLVRLPLEEGKEGEEGK